MFKISSPSDVTRMRSILDAFIAASIDHEINGFPATSTKFLFGIPFDPALAGMTATTFIINLGIAFDSLHSKFDLIAVNLRIFGRYSLIQTQKNQFHDAFG